jgi:hypothetical protein
MYLLKLFFLIFAGVLMQRFTWAQKPEFLCDTAFTVIAEYEVIQTIEICSDSEKVPFQYKSAINIPVCDDTLCANVILKIHWDLAGNYSGFDTIPGFPLTKFDHKKFTTADYQKLNEILKNKNSMLRILNKNDLIDKSVKVQSKTIDAVTGATPATIKKSVVEGAVYSSYSLWHFVNGPIKNQMANYTLDIYSNEISQRMLLSDNYETQLFALQKWSAADFENQSELLFQMIRKSAPVVKANTIIKTPLPFKSRETNIRFLQLFPALDNYSQSIFLNRILTEKNVAEVYLPLIIDSPVNFNGKQMDQVREACIKFEIQN